MINTFHTSYNPPPVPPRPGYSKPLPVGNTSLVKFLSVMLLLLMILTFGGFLYLYLKLNVVLHGSYPEDMTNQLRLRDCVNDKLGEDSVAECGKLIENYKAVIDKVLQTNEKVSRLTGGPSSFSVPAAHMVILNQQKDHNSDFLRSNYLLWDKEDSLLQDVRLSPKWNTLIIEDPGIYVIYSQVTFSKDSKNSLMQAVRTTEPKKEKDKVLLKSFCSLNPSKSDLCTASLVGVFKLKKDQQIYVAVTNTSLVNRDNCSFGLFKLR